MPAMPLHSQTSTGISCDLEFQKNEAPQVRIYAAGLSENLLAQQ